MSFMDKPYLPTYARPASHVQVGVSIPAIFQDAGIMQGGTKAYLLCIILS